MAIVSYNDLNIAGSSKQVMEIIWVKPKLESKDPLLERVWYSIELLRFGLAYYESAVYGHVDESVLLSFSCLGFTYGCKCMQTCLSIATVVASGCGSVVRLRTGKRLESPPRKQSPRTSHHRANADPYIVEWYYFDFASAMFQTLNTSLSMYFFCNSRIHVITLYSGHVCAVLCINASVLITRMNLG
jgi:hypothetical protein